MIYAQTRPVIRHEQDHLDHRPAMWNVYVDHRSSAFEKWRCVKLSTVDADVLGLIGLAATAIALGQDFAPFLGNIIPPILSCFQDPESRLRYHACESLYNM